MSIKGKKVLVLGLSKSGIAAANFANQHGAEVYLSEGKPITDDKLMQIKDLEKKGIHTEFSGHSEDFINKAELAITSPGIPPHSEILQRLKNKHIPIISELELCYRECDIPFIIITGTMVKQQQPLLPNIYYQKSLTLKLVGI